MYRFYIEEELQKEFKTLEEIKAYIAEDLVLNREVFEDLKTIEDLNNELLYFHEEMGYALMIVKKEEEVIKDTQENIKTLKDLKEEYGKDLEGIKKFEDLKSLASNFIRMTTWKKEKDLKYISIAYVGVIASVIKDIKAKGYNEALKDIKQGNLHKAYNIKYIYNYYGLDYNKEKQALKNQKLNILG